MLVAAIDVGVKNTAMVIMRDDRRIELMELFPCDRDDHRCMDPYLPLLQRCSIIGVETQLKINYGAVRLSQHIISTIRAKFGDSCPEIMDMHTSMKKKGFDAPKKDLKKWCVIKAQSLLHPDDISFIDRFRKKDDVSDCVLYAIALLWTRDKPSDQEPGP